jgi:hypothetical protein
MQQLPLSYSTVSVVPDAEERQLLPSCYHQPNEIDIVCERGRTFEKHPGNKKFSEAIRSNLQRYVEARRRVDKILIVTNVTSSLREGGARFIKLNNKSKCYYEISEDQAHKKTGHAIRDLLKLGTRSKKRSKMVAASRNYSHVVLGLSKESDPDSTTTVMMGRGRGSGPLMKSLARSTNSSFLVCSPAAW